MRRRDILLGIGITLSGCINIGAENKYEPDLDPFDGYPPLPLKVPPKQFFDSTTFDVAKVNSQTIPLSPLKTVYNWHQRGEARFVDSRSQTQYERSHILGSILSPAPSGIGSSDPTFDWPKNDRIVAYCGCPLHLSTLRAASLLNSGFTNVYVLKDGFWDWHDKRYPLAGTDLNTAPRTWTIHGKTDPSFSGKTVWIRELQSGQVEATMIQTNGEFTSEIRFSNISPTTSISIEAPHRTIVSPLSSLLETVIEI